METVKNLVLSKNLEFRYLKTPAHKFTFTSERLKRIIYQNCKGKVLNLFAGKNRICKNEFRVDLDPSTNPDYLGNAFDFVQTTNLKFDTIIFDPPYNIRKAREKYNGNYIGSDTKIKNSLVRLFNEDGLFIQLGYSSNGMSKKRGFELRKIFLINHSGNHNDTICIIEQKIKILDL